MKTPLTQLIETLKAIRDNAPHIQRSAYTKAINVAKEVLPIEEDAIKDARKSSLSSEYWFMTEAWINSEAAEYFNSTYPKPETKGDNDNN